MILELSKDQIHKWLYYETGFEQLHPELEIIAWMEEQGYQYQHDWKCVKTSVKRTYSLEFPNKEIQTLFMLRWS